METSFSINIKPKEKRDRRKKHPKQSIFYACEPVMHSSTLLGMPLYRRYGTHILSSHLINKIYGLILSAAVMITMNVLHPASFRLTISDPPLYYLTVLHAMGRALECIYKIVMTSFFNSHLYVNLLRNLDAADEHLSISKLAFYRRIRFVSCSRTITIWLLVFLTFVINLVVTGKLFNPSNLVLQLVLLINTLHAGNMFFMLQNTLLRLRLLNMIIESKIKSEKLHKYDFYKNRDRSVQKFLEITFLLRKTFFNQPRRLYCLMELMMIYDKLSEALYLFNIIHGSQVLIMTATLLLCTLLTICRALSPSLGVTYSWLSDMIWFIVVNTPILILVMYCELVRREQGRTEYFLNTLLLHDDLGAEYAPQLRTFLRLAVTRRRCHQVSAAWELFTLDLPLLLSLAGHTVSYATLLIQSYYINRI